MKITLLELARLVDGTCLGNPDLIIHGAAPIHNAQSGEITFVDAPERISHLLSCDASAVVTPRSLTPSGFEVIQVDDVPTAFAKIVNHFCPPRQFKQMGIHPNAVIDPTAKLGQDVSIGPGVYIGEEVVIGDRVILYSGVQILAGSQVAEDTTIFPNVVLYENSVVGPRCILHAGAVIGAYGFGYDSSSGTHVLSSQLGNVILEADVEVGACSTIDRGTYGPTRIGEGTKIDNLVMIAHNCRLGKNNLICANVGIAGSTTTGDYVVMAGRVGVRDHVHIGDRAVLGAMAGIMADVPEDARLVGIPATPEREQMRIQASLARLPEMRREMQALKSTVNQLILKVAQLHKEEEH
ncbi:MAG: UDP-3-O-(3-hydroxymyristoyl)glucosamine N-acyltransferase [Planctomycetaceae bacterium]|nr:UDP-3-O-(3-hydroxymyristoyl)glucosamine N-acyltransferase [Planctomycetaceae bacterium]